MATRPTNSPGDHRAAASTPSTGPLETDLPLLSEGRLLQTAEVAVILGVSVRRVYALRDDGLLIGTSIGRSLRFRPSDVMTLIIAGRDEGWPAT